MTVEYLAVLKAEMMVELLGARWVGSWAVDWVV